MQASDRRKGRTWAIDMHFRGCNILSLVHTQGWRPMTGLLAAYGYTAGVASPKMRACGGAWGKCCRDLGRSHTLAAGADPRFRQGGGREQGRTQGAGVCKGK